MRRIITRATVQRLTRAAQMVMAMMLVMARHVRTLPMAAAWAQRAQTQAHVRRRIGPVLALAALLLVGALVALAAPRGATPRTTAAANALASASPTNGRRTVSQHLMQTGSTPGSTPAPTATDTPGSATATATPLSPTATAAPPTPTATPSPTWHTIGTYSGSTAQTLVTISPVQGSIRIRWTCSITPPSPASWDFYVFLSGGIGGGVNGCNAGHTADSSVYPANGATSSTISIQADGATMGAWTVTVDELY